MAKYGMYVYFRTTPRSNTKFGITICPWERCRQFQQGTDEIVEFDHLYLMTSTHYDWVFEKIEEKLNYRYSNYCLVNTTQRAGHTEWYKGLNHADWEQAFKDEVYLMNTRGYPVELRKITQAYRATKKSHCVYKMPTGSDDSQAWIRKNYQKFPVLA